MGEPPEHDSSILLLTRMEQEPDDMLLLYMACCDEDEPRARAAFTVFYNRHKEYLYRVCAGRFGSSMDGAEKAADLVTDTFVRAYESADTFDLDSTLTDDEARRCVRAWIGKIAKNLFLSLHNANADTLLLSEEEGENLDRQCAEETENPETWSENRRLLEEALDTLNEKERIVINFTYAYYKLESENQRLPNHVSQQIAEMIGTKRSTLRKIRQRAIDKIKAYFAQHRPNPERT